MKTAVWKAALAALVLFILGAAAGAATIDMLDEGSTTVTRSHPVTSVETLTDTVTRTRTVTEESPGAVAQPGWSVCTNARGGYSIAYPSGWYTTHLRPAQACEYFDPEPFEIIEGTEFPPTGLFASFSTQPVDEYLAQLTDPMFFETLRREETTVNGLPAVLVETSSTGQGESEPGQRTYGYVIDRNGRAFAVLAIGLPGDEQYEVFKSVADDAVQTVRFL
jgi:hypothetical protein